MIVGQHVTFTNSMLKKDFAGRVISTTVPKVLRNLVLVLELGNFEIMACEDDGYMRSGTRKIVERVHEHPISDTDLYAIFPQMKPLDTVYRLRRSVDAGFATNETDHGLFRLEEGARFAAEQMEPREEIRSYEFHVHREAIK